MVLFRDMASQQKGAKGKQNGVAEKEPAQHGKHVHGAGDECDSDHDEDVIMPLNIIKRINALKHIHMDVQKVEVEMHGKLFALEAEHHKKMAPLLKKRADIISGLVDPSDTDSKFVLREGEPEPKTGEASDEKGIPKFWKAVLCSSNHTAPFISDEDSEVIDYITDIRTTYSEQPLGFALEFEFAENPFFSNNVLTRTYEFGTNIGREEMYITSGLSPKFTKGTEIKWKEGKNTTKKVEITFQRNKKTGERRQIKDEKDCESFFKFFMPEVEDLSTFNKSVGEGDEAEDDDVMAQKGEQAEMDFEMASSIRTRIIPRALLIFTGQEDDDDEDYDDEEDFDEDDGNDNDDDGDEESDESEDAGPGPFKKPNAPGQGKQGAGQQNNKQQKGPRKS